jgi:16S rRNA (cytidine1402-2'-O)-methyltransferase
VDREEGTDPGGGGIVLVGTPIGNLGDLPPRAVEVLAQAEVVYCEDTRRTRALLTHAGVTGSRLRSLHGHNEHQRLEEVVRAASDGALVAVVSDAGMPGVSDPGTRVVQAAVAAGVRVSVVPGPSALLAALVTSGLPTDRFCFEGFLPRTGRARAERLAAVASEPRTVVLYEAPGRVAGTLGDLAATCGTSRRVAVARELTKLHEEIWRGPLGEAASWASGDPLRGEVVLVVEGGAPAESEVDDETLRTAVEQRVSAGARRRGAVDEVAAEFGVPRRRVYQLALSGGPEPGEDPDGWGRRRNGRG